MSGRGHADFTHRSVSSTKERQETQLLLFTIFAVSNSSWSRITAFSQCPLLSSSQRRPVGSGHRAEGPPSGGTGA